ncbi:hypothetical protein D9M70_258110 [compost metagenome]
MQRRQDVQHIRQRVVHGQQRTDHGQQVAQVEAPQQRAAQQAFALMGNQLGTHAVIVEVGFAAIKESAGIFQAVTEQTRLVLFGGQLTAEFVIQVDHPRTQVRPAEQLGLGSCVGLHRTMEVQVVAGQVGERCDVEVQRGDPALLQAMGGNLHCHGTRAGLFQACQGGLHGQRIGRGVATAFQLAIEAGTQGTDDAAALAQLVEGLGQQLADAGLAIGAGDTHQAQGAARLTIEAAGDGR